MFTLRAAPHRQPSTWRQTFTPRHMPRYTYPGDSSLLEDLTGFMLLPFFESMMDPSSDKQTGQRERHKAKNWVHKLDLSGYEPDDVTITTKDGRVLIKARRIEGEGDCSDVYESNRSVTIPEGVDFSSMTSHFTSDGLLTIVANAKTEDKNMASKEVPVENAKDEQMTLTDHDGNGDSSDDNKEELEIHHGYEETPVEEALETSEEDGKKVSDETQKAFTLSFNKDQLAGDDVKVLVKGNSLLVKSQDKTCEDGVSRSVYYVTQHTLPDDIDVSNVSCSRRPDGELVITAPHLN